MSKFVQKSERSLELPLGCKDLMDVDSIRNWTQVEHPDWPKRTVDQLAYMEGYLARLLQSAGEAALVCVGCSQTGAMVMVVPAPDLAGSAIFARWNNASQEEALRAVFDDAEASPLVEPVGRWKSKKALKYPLAEDPSEAARFICEVLRNGYGLGDLASISLFFHEAKAA